MNVFESVKMGVSMKEVAEMYGMEVSHNGKALCPFHTDRHPSLFVADDHYHCFACGEHGDVIDFVAKLYGLSLYEAAKKLAYDFGIQTDKPPTKAMQEKQHRKTEAQRLRETEKLCFSALMAYFHLLEDWKVIYAPRTPEEEVDSRFTEACHNLPQVEYWVDLLLSGDSYERAEVIDRMTTDAILRFAKYKGPEISGIEAHNERTKEKYASNPDIDPSRTHLNFHLIKPERKYRAEAEKQIAEAGCRTRSDSVRVVEALITATPEFFKGKKMTEIKEFFSEALEFMKQNQAPETIISAVVHMDEKTPHMPFVLSR